VTLLEQLAQPLLTARQDFSAAFMIINQIKAALPETPDAGLAPLFQICEQLMTDPGYRCQKQAYFFYRSVAQTLQRVALRSDTGEDPDPRRALQLLNTGMMQSHEALRRAMAETLGSLPLAIDRVPQGPEPIDGGMLPESPPLCDARWLADRGIQRINGWEWQGRSLRAVTRSGEMLVVKCLRKDEDPASLVREAAWMDYLKTVAASYDRTFVIPRSLPHDQGHLVKAPVASRHAPVGTGLHPQRYAIAFTVSPDYFHYPNEAHPQRRLDARQISEVLGRNAWLLGRLMAEGIAHTALIPLFHNRAQGHRREDGGRYRWPHAGRLDRWLASCRYPNFGVSGLRDFEHFERVEGRPCFRYEIIGSHLISLVLVAGSYFRQQRPDRVGFDASGRPVDVRDLFDRELFQNMLRDIFRFYYEGFTDGVWCAHQPVMPDITVDRMIEEMGVDRHMEEVLRVADQGAMDRSTFAAFLEARGIPRDEARQMPKGREDIPLMTGPHLGGFNQAISLPELIAFAATGSARCVLGRFRREREGLI